MKAIIRYSINGFKPQYQSCHLNDIYYNIYNFNIDDFPEYLQYAIQERHDRMLPFYKEHYKDFQYGVWFFLQGHKNNQALNHLKKKFHVGKRK